MAALLNQTLRETARNSRSTNNVVRVVSCRASTSAKDNRVISVFSSRNTSSFLNNPKRNQIIFMTNTKRWCSSSFEKTIVVPPMGDSISEGTILEWLKKEGDQIKVDDVVVTIETDKVRVDIRAPDAGVISKVFTKEGEDVRIGQDLFTIKIGATGSSKSEKETPKPKKEEKEQSVSSKPTSKSEPKSEPKSEQKSESKPEQKSEPKSEPKSEQKPDKKSETKPQQTTETRIEPTKGSREEKRVKMTKIRQRIAVRLKESQNTAAMLTTFNEIDMSKIINLREKHKDSFQTKHGVKLGFMSTFVKAASAALSSFPIVNAFIDGDYIVYRDYHDISVAVASPNGLIVPVIRNVETLNFSQIEKIIHEYSLKARDGSIPLEDMAGGTFTISNGGVFGSLFGTPIINPPQSAILGMHAINKRPHVVGEEIKIRPIMFIALTYDHRIIDGREAVLFLRKIKECVEDPDLLLLDL